MSFCNKWEIVGAKDLQITRFTEEDLQKTISMGRPKDLGVLESLLSLLRAPGPPLGVAVLSDDH